MNAVVIDEEFKKVMELESRFVKVDWKNLV